MVIQKFTIDFTFEDKFYLANVTEVLTNQFEVLISDADLVSRFGPRHLFQLTEDGQIEFSSQTVKFDERFHNSIGEELNARLGNPPS